MASKKELTKAARDKRAFRASTKWKNFRQQIYHSQNGKDLITLTPLPKSFHVHHRLLSEDEYSNIENGDNFIGLLPSLHKNVIHLLLRYIKKYHSMEVVDRLYDELKLEAKLNGYIDEDEWNDWISERYSKYYEQANSYKAEEVGQPYLFEAWLCWVKSSTFWTEERTTLALRERKACLVLTII